MDSWLPDCSCRIILETDPSVIANRVSMRGADADLPLSEQVSTPAQLRISWFKSMIVHRLAIFGLLVVTSMLFELGEFTGESKSFHCSSVCHMSSVSYAAASAM